MHGQQNIKTRPRCFILPTFLQTTWNTQALMGITLKWIFKKFDGGHRLDSYG